MNKSWLTITFDKFLPVVSFVLTMAWLFNWKENIRTFVPVSIDKDVSCYAMFFSARPVRFCDAISLVKTGKFLLKFKIIVIVTMSCVLSLRWTIESGSGMQKAREFRWVNSRIQVYFLKRIHTYVHRLQMESKGKVKTNSCEVNFWGSSCYTAKCHYSSSFLLSIIYFTNSGEQREEENRSVYHVQQF